MTDNEALEIIHRIKQGADVTETIRTIEEANLLLQMSLTPETSRL